MVFWMACNGVPHLREPSCVDFLGVAFVDGASEGHGLPHHQVVLSDRASMMTGVSRRFRQTSWGVTINFHVTRNAC